MPSHQNSLVTSRFSIPGIPHLHMGCSRRHAAAHRPRVTSLTLPVVPTTLDQPRLGTHANVRFNAEVLLVTFLGPEHLQITLAGRHLVGWSCNQRGIHHLVS